MRYRRLKNNRGQGMTEYLVLLAIVITVVVAFLNGPFRNALNGMLNNSAGLMEGVGGDLGGGG
jgi:Flp pilus assembly pilin Flp